MKAWTRVPFLIRLASRYAVRHRTQTLRAILGLLVATTVLAMGLGLPESIAVSLEETALARFGPVDVSVTALRPFDERLVDRLASDPTVRAEGAVGAATLTVAGPAIHQENGLAEALATIRGVSNRERDALGPLPSTDGRPVPEPGPGEVVLSASLARTLDATVGDRIVLRAPPAGAPDVDFEPTVLLGLAGVPEPAVQAHTLEVRPGAIGLGAEVAWTQQGPTVSVEATSPSGVPYANQSATSPTRLIVEGPVEPGTWTVRVRADGPVPYQGGLAAVYVPEAAFAFVSLEVRVVGIAAEEGRAGITGRPTALVQLGSLQGALNTTGNATQIYFHVPGDATRTADAIDRVLRDSEDTYDVRADKVELLQNAAEVGAEMTGFLLVMGAFTLLAAILLAFTLFSALVEERRAELGIARALGLTRGEVAFMMTVEGGLYAALAALVGLLVGLGFLWGLLSLIDAFAAGRGGITFGMHVGPGTLVTAFGVGTLLPLLTIGLASLRFARLDPARAIRGIPDDPRSRRRTGMVFAGFLLVAGLGLSFLGAVPQLAGVPLLLAGMAVASWSLGSPRVAAALALGAVARLVWTLYAFDGFSESTQELDPILTLGRGAILALGLSALAVATPRPYERVAAWLGRGKAQRASFLAFKYIVARRRPAGLTMAMISLVVVIVTVMGTLFAVFGGAIAEDEAGFSVLGDSPLALDTFPSPLPNDIAPKVEVSEFLPQHIELQQAIVTRDGETIQMMAGMRQFLGVTPSFARTNEYTLTERAPQYATDRAAWEAVAAGGAILPPDWMLQRNGLAAGDILIVETAASGPKTYILAGGVDSDFVFQTFFPADDVRAMGFPTTTRVYVRAVNVEDSNEIAHRLTGAFAEDGLTFVSVPEEVARIGQAAQALVLVFESFLALGLFVGLAATGFLASRAVHERIREIGTLRALGYEERDVRRAFMLESTLTAGMGILIGTLSGLVVAHSIWWRSVRDGGVAFQPPLLIMAIFTIAVLGLAALASRGPAARASRLPPAIAVRHVE